MWASKEKTWSQAFLAETVETGHKYCDVTYNILFERPWAFLEWVGPRILSLESVDYFRTSEYFSGQKKKKNLYEQKFSETKMVRLTGHVL